MTRPIQDRNYELLVLLDCSFETLAAMQVWRKWRF